MGDIFPLFAKGLELVGVGVWAILGAMFLGYFKWKAEKGKTQHLSDSSLRADLLARLCKVEGDFAQERSRAALEVADLRRQASEDRKRCDEELSDQRKTIQALERRIIQMQISTAQVLPIGPLSTEMQHAIEILDTEINKRQGND